MLLDAFFLNLFFNYVLRQVYVEVRPGAAPRFDGAVQRLDFETLCSSSIRRDN
jgi:hypothetical protein